MARTDEASAATEEALRQEAAAWFARLHGPFAARHRPDFEIWVAADPRRRAIYARLERRWDEAAVLVGTQSQARIASRREPHRRLQVASLAVAAATCGLTLALYLAPARPAFLDEAGIPSAWWRAVHTEVGETRTERLADGSSVMLDTDTLVLMRQAGAERGMKLVRGRARFDGETNGARRFAVEAGGADIAAQAALFDVAYSEDQGVSVIPLTGMVDIVQRRRATTGGAAVRLRSGQAWSLRRGTGPARIGPATAGASLWPTGVLTFTSTPLSEALAEANRYSRQHVVLADPTLGQLEVSGVFKARATEALARALATTFDLHVQALADGDLQLSCPSAASPIEPPR